jgi:hypothetical protein
MCVVEGGGGRQWAVERRTPRMALVYDSPTLFLFQEKKAVDSRGGRRDELKSRNEPQHVRSRITRDQMAGSTREQLSLRWDGNAKYLSLDVMGWWLLIFTKTQPVELELEC